MDDSFGDFLSGVPTASVPGVNTPQPAEPSTLETAPNAPMNVTHMDVHDPEKRETKGEKDGKYT